jgi:hypothetical protein
MVGVTAHPHADQLDERRAVTSSCAIGGPCKRSCHGFRVGPVDGDSRDAVAGGLVGKDTGRALFANRRRERRLIVLDAEHGGQASRGAEIDRLVPLAKRRPSLADE